MNFDEAFDLLLGHEGGFQNDPRDRGNWTGGDVGKGVCKGTRYGISAASYPGEDIEHLTVERAKELARRDFWGPAGCDAVPDVLKFDLFDTAFNSSSPGHPVTAVKMLQRAAGMPAAEVDGSFGSDTLMAVQRWDPYRLLVRFEGERLDYLNGLKTFPIYGVGWTQRMAENMKRV